MLLATGRYNREQPVAKLSRHATNVRLPLLDEQVAGILTPDHQPVHVLDVQ